MNDAREEYEDLFKSYDHLQLSNYSESAIEHRGYGKTDTERKLHIIAMRDNYDGKNCPKCGYDKAYNGWCFKCSWRFEKIDDEVLIIDSQRVIDNFSSMRGRTYGKSICVCRTEFIKKSPTQTYCTRDCWRLHHPRYK